MESRHFWLFSFLDALSGGAAGGYVQERTKRLPDSMYCDLRRARRGWRQPDAQGAGERAELEWRLQKKSFTIEPYRNGA
jgi:hypothetical protein